jgi:hypothetical protein
MLLNQYTENNLEFFSAFLNNLHCEEGLMKKVLVFLGLLVFVIVSVNGVFADRSKIIDQRNEYGGKTEEESYSIGDEKYKEGIAKLIEYYDGNERIMKLETVFSDDHARLDGVQRSVQFYDNKFYRTGKRTRVEFYYTDAYGDREGVAKAILYYNEEEQKIKTDYFYTDAYAKKRQTFRLEVQYNEKGNVVKRTYFDKDGKVLSVEDKKKD